MGKFFLGMTMSLDGFINDRNRSVELLYSDLEALRDTEPLRESIQKQTDERTFTFVTDGIESAVQRAKVKVAAGDKDVTIIGAANTSRQCLNVGLADELHVDIMPVLLGGGLRPFEGINSESIQLERLKMVELPGGRIHLRFRVIKP